MRLIVNTDGASRGNPGPASYGFVIRNQSGETVYQEGKRLGITTNNVAEYTAVLASLRYIDQNFPKDGLEIVYQADSLLVIQQLKGVFQIKNPRLKIIYQEIKTLEEKFEQILFLHVPREENKTADRLANAALDNH